MDYVVTALVRVFMMVRVLWNTFVDVMGFVATASWLKDTETSIKGREGVEFNKKRFVHRTLLLDDIKFVKYAMDSTVNDVLLAITSAGLTSYLRRKYGLMTMLCPMNELSGVVPLWIVPSPPPLQDYHPSDEDVCPMNKLFEPSTVIK